MDWYYPPDEERSTDIYVSRLIDGEYTEPERVSDKINSRFHDFDPFVAPDESYLVFCSIRPGDMGMAICTSVFAKRMDPGAKHNTWDQNLTPLPEKTARSLRWTASTFSSQATRKWPRSQVKQSLFKIPPVMAAGMSTGLTPKQSRLSDQTRIERKSPGRIYSCASDFSSSETLACIERIAGIFQ